VYLLRPTTQRISSQIVVFKYAAIRSHATHRNHASDLLSQTLDVKRGTRREDTVGPFVLGVPPSQQSAENVKKWSQLSPGGKAVRTASRTGNLVVILFGAGFSALLLYALTSELFSKNSPTVLYKDACKLIETSPRVSRHLHGPLTFHNNPPSAVRPRHRNRHVSSYIRSDKSGREHMFLHFYIQGSQPGTNTTDAPEGYLDSMVHWTSDGFSRLNDMSFDDVVDGVRARAAGVAESSKALFRFLSGESTSTPPTDQPPVRGPTQVEKKSSNVWSFAGLFSGIKGRQRGDGLDAADDRVFLEGEAHAELIRNDQGYFDFKDLIVEIPNSHASNRIQVAVILSGQGD